jgi:DNA-binding NtrC family response regulator
MPSYMSESYMTAKRKVVAEFTTAYLKSKLALHDGHISKAAEDSGIPRQHFSLLMKRYLDTEA